MKLFIFLCLLICIVNVQSKTPAIVNGTDAELKDVPFQIALYRNGGFLCGGSLIGKNKIVTAAHCVQDPGVFTVRIGLSDLLSPNSLNISVSKVSIHPKWDKEVKKGIDIAVVTLEKNVNLEDFENVTLAELQTEELPIGSEVTVYGWGAIEFLFVSDKLKKTTMIVQHSDDLSCIAARNQYSTICYGDSGGPLVSSDGKLAGIVSRLSVGGCYKGDKNYFTKVSDFIIWILAQ